MLMKKYLQERKIQLEAIKYIDKIIIYETENDLYRLLYDMMPDVRILGTDYEHKYFTGIDIEGIDIYFHKRDHNYSSTEIRKKIESRFALKFLEQISDKIK